MLIPCFIKRFQAGANNGAGTRYSSEQERDASVRELIHSCFDCHAAYQSDPRFRKYVQLIEKNLNSFDAVNEWADIISFLGRLLKVCSVYDDNPKPNEGSSLRKNKRSSHFKHIRNFRSCHANIPLPND